MTTQFPVIGPRELAAAHAAGETLILLDVREANEFAAMRAPFSAHHALSLLRNGTLPPFAKSERLYVVCQAGARSEAATVLLRNAGFENVTNVVGGMTAWEKAGLPVSRG